jgi:hypothetical protein
VQKSEDGVIGHRETTTVFRRRGGTISEVTMSHDKLKAAIRKRMARTGEPYSVARRALLGGDSDNASRWFEISYRNEGLDRMTALLDSLLGDGPGTAGVRVDGDQLQLRMGRWRQRIARSSVRSARRSSEDTHGTTGVHVRDGRLLVNGSPDGLVELRVDPPFRTDRALSTGFVRARVDRVVVSLVDPEAFLAALAVTSDANE